MVDATIPDVAPQTDEERMSIQENIAKTAALFANIAEEDMRKDRSGLLGLLELEKRARAHGLASGP